VVKLKLKNMKKVNPNISEIKEEIMYCENCGCPCSRQFCSKTCKKEYEFDNK
jgi:hypothetical protein